MPKRHFLLALVASCQVCFDLATALSLSADSLPSSSRKSGSLRPASPPLNSEVESDPPDLSRVFLQLAASAARRKDAAAKDTDGYWPVAHDTPPADADNKQDISPRSQSILNNIHSMLDSVLPQSSSSDSVSYPEPELLAVLARKNNPNLKLDLKTFDEAESLLKKVEMDSDKVGATFYRLKLKNFPYDTSTPPIPGEFQYPKGIMGADSDDNIKAQRLALNTALTKEKMKANELEKLEKEKEELRLQKEVTFQKSFKVAVKDVEGDGDESR